MPPTRDLRPFPLADVLPLGSHPGQQVVTMSEGQWDGLLSAAYQRGWILLELDDDERPVRAYRNTAAAPEPTGSPEARPTARPE
jgi:hypothetical protein